MKVIILAIITLAIFAGCASKEFDQRSYDRQNRAAEKSLKSLEN